MRWYTGEVRRRMRKSDWLDPWNLVPTSGQETRYEDYTRLGVELNPYVRWVLYSCSLNWTRKICSLAQWNHKQTCLPQFWVGKKKPQYSKWSLLGSDTTFLMWKSICQKLNTKFDFEPGNLLGYPAEENYTRGIIIQQNT